MAVGYVYVATTETPDGAAQWSMLASKNCQQRQHCSSGQYLVSLLLVRGDLLVQIRVRVRSVDCVLVNLLMKSV